jgi:hypothetical protein
MNGIVLITTLAEASQTLSQRPKMLVTSAKPPERTTMLNTQDKQFNDTEKDGRTRTERETEATNVPANRQLRNIGRVAGAWNRLDQIGRWNHGEIVGAGNQVRQDAAESYPYMIFVALMVVAAVLLVFALKGPRS